MIATLEYVGISPVKFIKYMHNLEISSASYFHIRMNHSAAKTGTHDGVE